MTNLDWILSLALAVALTGTAILCRYALSNSLIDVPNSRSSHVQPILMGGGVAIVVSFVLSSVLLALTGQTQWPLIPAIAVLGGGVSVIGFLDDYDRIPARWRLFCRFIVAVTGLVPIQRVSADSPLRDVDKFILGWLCVRKSLSCLVVEPL